MSAPYQGLGPTLAECLTAEKVALTAELAQVKAERDEAVRRWAAEVNEQTGVIFELRADCAALESGRDARWRLVECESCRDPKDMWKGVMEFVGYEDDPAPVCSNKETEDA